MLEYIVKILETVFMCRNILRYRTGYACSKGITYNYTIILDIVNSKTAGKSHKEKNGISIQKE